MAYSSIHSLKLVKVSLAARGTVEDTFPNRVIERWNQLDQGAVDATRINAFTSKLDRFRCLLV